MSGRPLDFVVGGALGGLLVLTVLYAIGSRSKAVRALHVLGFVPQWAFFAPTPGVQNLFLLYRDVHIGGDATTWRMLHGMDEPRSVWACAWNPQRRLRKALHDLITQLSADRAAAASPELLKMSTPYLLIVHHVSNIPRLSGVWATQFLIMVSDPYEPPQVAFQSELHRLGGHAG